MRECDLFQKRTRSGGKRDIPTAGQEDEVSESAEEWQVEQASTSARGTKATLADSPAEMEELDQALGLFNEVKEFVKGEEFLEASPLEAETQLELLEMAFKELMRLKKCVGVSKDYAALKNRLKEKTGQTNQATVQVMSGKGSLPRFAGRYSKWAKFEAAFRVGVHLKRMTDEEKLDKLLQCLSGAPKILLQRFDRLEEGTYKEAWKLLEATYNNSSEAFAEHVKDVFDQGRVRQGDARQAREAIGIMQDAVGKATKILQEKNGLSCSAAVHLVSIMDSKTREQWRMQYAKADHVPDLEEVAAFYLEKVKTWTEKEDRESRSRKRSLEPDDRSMPVRVKKEKQWQGKDQKRGRFGCFRCNGDHRLLTCKVFQQDTLEKRQELFERLSLCICCAGRHSGECHRDCSKCKGSHNVLLCPKAQSQ